MLFHSVSFLLFFAIVAVLYFSIPRRFQWVWLLGASYFFYVSSQPEYLLLIFFLTFLNYFVAIQMGKRPIKSDRKNLFLLVLVGHLGLLFAFKYYNFFHDSLKILFGQGTLFDHLSAFQFLLPLGISFYTFKSLSYAIDVYRGDQRPERHLGRYALYVAFFPQLLAGPIERAKRLLPQLSEQVEFNYYRATDGLKLMLWGFFQKMVIADNLAPLVDAVYNHPVQYEGAAVVVATFFFTFQIYCDFSGYSDIAIGAAQVVGFTTMDNFDRPYFSKSIQEFWRRWHISLSTWFRDYLYIPLGGNRVSTPRWYFNLFIVLVICGLWHGANWTFILWGGLHGFYLVFSAFTRRARNKIHQALGLHRIPRLHNYLKGLITFFLICFAWIFFRANNISDALCIVSHLFMGWGDLLELGGLKSLFGGPLKFECMTGVVSIGILIFIENLRRERSLLQHLSQKPVWLRWAVYYTMVFGILLFGQIGERQFIYFQF